MKIIVTSTLGSSQYTYEIDENKELEALHKAIVLGSPPQYCHECQNKEYFKMDSNKDKDGNIYVNTVCLKCGAKAKLGQYKAGGYFWHKFEKYVRPASQNASQEGSDFNNSPF